MTSSDCGIHIHNGDGDGLADAIRAYADSETLRTTHSAAARRTFDDAFDRRHGLAAIMTLLRG